MKSLKAAAVLAGSMIVAGFAAPAVAHSATAVTPTGLTGAANQLAEGDVSVQPLQPNSKTADTGNKGAVLRTVEGTQDALGRNGSGYVDGGFSLHN